MVGINEELEAAEAAKAALSAINPNSQATIRILRQAKYVAALAMTTLPSDKPLNDARHAVVITLSDVLQHGVLHGDLDALALPGVAAPVEGRQNADGKQH